MKTCTKCKIEKPCSQFAKDSSRADGLKSACKQCKSACNAEYYSRNAAIIAKNYSENRQIIRQKQKQYAAKSSEKIRARHAKWRSENREKVIGYQSRMKDKYPGYLAEYRARNPEKCSEHSRNRRARKRNAEGSHTATDIARIFEHQRGLCANCHAKLFKSGKQTFHVDHIVPLAKGGSNWPDNLQCLCPQCNNRKRAKDPIAWANENGRLL